MKECTPWMHVFSIEEGTLTAPELRCLCGGTTWGAMNARLMVTETITAGSRN